MSTFDDATKLVSSLSRGEKAQILQMVAKDIGDAYPGIETTPGVCGGEACIVRTRIPVWLLEQAKRLGTSEGELLLNFPTLRAEDLVNAWAYAARTGRRSRIRSALTRRFEGWPSGPLCSDNPRSG